MKTDIKKMAGGKGTGPYRRGNVLTQITDVEVGQLLIVDSKTYRATNLAKVTQTFSDKFYALFANAENPAEKRQSSDEEFVVYPHDLDKGEYYIALEPAPGLEQDVVKPEGEAKPAEKNPEVGQKAKVQMPSKDEALADAEGKAEAKPEPKGRDESKEASKKASVGFGYANPIETIEDLDGDIEMVAKEGMQRFVSFIMADGGRMCYDAVKQEYELVKKNTQEYLELKEKSPSDTKQWAVIGMDLNEDYDDLVCDHMGTKIERLYGSKKVAVHPAGEATQEAQAKSKYALELAKTLFISSFADEIMESESRDSENSGLEGVVEKMGYNESGKDLTEYVPEIMEEHGLEMPTAALEKLGQELVNNINAKWEGKLTVDELLDKFPHVAIDLALGSQGHGVSPEDDAEVSVFMDDKGVSSHQLYQEPIGDQIRDEAYGVLSAFMGRKEASKAKKALALPVITQQELRKEQKQKEKEKKEKEKTAAAPATEKEKPEPQLLAAWDDSDILSGMVEAIKEDPDRMAELKEDGVDVDDDNALFNVAVEDQDLFSTYWEDFVNDVNSVLKERKSSSGVWDISGRNMGWQSRSGEKRAKIETYDDLRDKVLPKTSELTITMTAGEGDSIDMRVSHHDAPTGEFYTLTPIEPLVTGDKVKITSVVKTYDNEWVGKEATIVSFDGVDQYDDGVMTYTVEDEEGNQLDVTDSDFEAVAKTASKKTADTESTKDSKVFSDEAMGDWVLAQLTSLYGWTANKQSLIEAYSDNNISPEIREAVDELIARYNSKEELAGAPPAAVRSAKTVKAFGEEPASAMERPDKNPITKDDPDVSSVGRYSETTPEAEPEKEEQYIAVITLKNGKTEKVPFDADSMDIEADVEYYLEKEDVDWKSWKWEDMGEVHTRPDEYEFVGSDVSSEEEEEYWNSSEEDIFIGEDEKSAFYAGKQIVEVNDHDQLATAIHDWMEKEKWFPNIWWVSDHGNPQLYIIKKKGSVDQFEETASRDIPEQMPIGSHGTFMSELLAGIETIKEAGNSGEVDDDGSVGQQPMPSNFTGVNETEKFDRTEAALVVDELLAAKAVSAVDFDGFMEVMADVYCISKEASKDFSEPFFNDDAKALIAAIKTNLN